MMKKVHFTLMQQQKKPCETVLRRGHMEFPNSKLQALTYKKRKQVCKSFTCFRHHNT